MVEVVIKKRRIPAHARSPQPRGPLGRKWAYVNPAYPHKVELLALAGFTKCLPWTNSPSDFNQVQSGDIVAGTFLLESYLWAFARTHEVYALEAGRREINEPRMNALLQCACSLIRYQVREMPDSLPARAVITGTRSRSVLNAWCARKGITPLGGYFFSELDTLRGGKLRHPEQLVARRPDTSWPDEPRRFLWKRREPPEALAAPPLLGAGHKGPRPLVVQRDIFGIVSLGQALEVCAYDDERLWTLVFPQGQRSVRRGAGSLLSVDDLIAQGAQMIRYHVMLDVTWIPRAWMQHPAYRVSAQAYT